MVQRKQKIKSENGQAEPKQEEHFELLIHAPPAADHAPNQRGKKQRRIENEMFAKKFQRLERTKADFFRQTAAPSQMGQRDPGMLPVPDDRRNCAEKEKREQ